MKKYVWITLLVLFIMACGTAQYNGGSPTRTPMSQTDIWIYNLRMTGTTQYDQAVEGLSKSGPEVIPLLIKAPRLPGDGVDQLIITFGESAVDPLINALNDPDGIIRYHAVVDLGEIGDKRAGKVLMPLIHDKEPSIQRAAIIALGQLGEVEAVEPISRRLINIGAHNEVVALGEIGDPGAVKPIMDAYRDGWLTDNHDDIVEAMGKIGSPAVDMLIPYLLDEKSLVRGLAAESLGKIGDASAVEPLEGMLADEEPYAQLLVQDALVEIGTPAVESLIPLLADPNPEMRNSAARVLGKIGDPKAVDALLPLLTDSDNTVRIAAIDALGNIKDGRAVDPLLPLLENNDKTIRMRTAGALGFIKDERVTILMNRILQENNLELIAGAHKYFILAGIPGSENQLIAAMNATNDVSMVEDLLNCDRPALFIAARQWVKDHNALTIYGSGEPGLDWGSGQ